MNSHSAEDPDIWNQLELSNHLSYEEISTYTIPITFCALPAYIDKIWMTVKNDALEYSDSTCKIVLKKVMLILAEAKVCFAQKTVPSERHLNELRQKYLYSNEEFIQLNSLLVEDLPYPLAAYLECIGVAKEGNKTLIPVLAESQDMYQSRLISYGPRYMFSSWQEIYKESTNILKCFPRINYDTNKKLKKSFHSFWFVDDKIFLSDRDKKIFRSIVSNFTGLKTQMNLLNGRGNLAQIIQTPKWTINTPIVFYSMIKCSDFYMKLGAAFGFTYTHSHEVQLSRYHCNDQTAYMIAKVKPSNVIDCILNHTFLF
ncbi:uncharacterized protein LOC123675943 [Harmonia axyridis]|uniref:uncharacterized protein LOC123675943 n=1 Tax=Harmonia axyridis TaxID=115357 RepID=UPI001E279B2B|nr:uncharacterized protein LOC123675943 [Harmonia axyridis]XP_045467478.1 uncharacterized protein LOC123675943 [Harmonia axyridis]